MKQVLRKVREILKTPEGADIIEHAEKIMFFVGKYFEIPKESEFYKEQPTPSKEDWAKINKAQKVLDNGFVANSDKIYKKSPSKCSHEWEGIVDGKQEKFSKCIKCGEPKPTKKPKND